MSPLMISAQFAAYVWYSKRFIGDAHDAATFAKVNWPKFLPLANRGLGRLLETIAAKKSKPREKATSFHPQAANLKTLSSAFSRIVWPHTN